MQGCTWQHRRCGFRPSPPAVGRSSISTGRATRLDPTARARSQARPATGMAVRSPSRTQTCCWGGFKLLTFRTCLDPMPTCRSTPQLPARPSRNWPSRSGPRRKAWPKVSLRWQWQTCPPLSRRFPSSAATTSPPAPWPVSVRPPDSSPAASPKTSAWKRFCCTRSRACCQHMGWVWPTSRQFASSRSGDGSTTMIRSRQRPSCALPAAPPPMR